MTFVAGKVALNISYEGLLWTVLLIMMKKVASFKKNTQFKTRLLKPYHTKMAKIDTLFMTKTAENPTLWGRTYLYSPHKGVPTPGKKVNSDNLCNSLPPC